MKIRAGRLDLRAYHKGGNVYIEIQDDGRGLNREKILKKAIELDLIQEDAKMEDRDVWRLIFEPGFSTAEKVTEVSGRGVGMDVVNRSINNLRGNIEIQSTPGEGTTFSIRLPLTLASTVGISGGAIMSDGNVGLILDVGGLVRLAHQPKLRSDDLLNASQAK